jgi:hypothetical protein
MMSQAQPLDVVPVCPIVASRMVRLCWHLAATFTRSPFELAVPQGVVDHLARQVAFGVELVPSLTMAGVIARVPLALEGAQPFAVGFSEGGHPRSLGFGIDVLGTPFRKVRRHVARAALTFRIVRPVGMTVGLSRHFVIVTQVA